MACELACRKASEGSEARVWRAGTCLLPRPSQHLPCLLALSLRVSCRKVSSPPSTRASHAFLSEHTPAACRSHACAFVLTRRAYKCAALRESMSQTPASASASWQVAACSGAWLACVLDQVRMRLDTWLPRVLPLSIPACLRLLPWRGVCGRDKAGGNVAARRSKESGQDTRPYLDSLLAPTRTPPSRAPYLGSLLEQISP